MYTLGNYNRALAKLTSEDGTRAETVEIERTPGGRLVIRAYRGGPELLGLALMEDGTWRAWTWDAQGEIAGTLELGGVAK
jgi:hypothetical protein